MCFEIQHVQVGSKNGPNIDQKMKCKIQCISAAIFERFWWILAAKLGSTWEKVGLKNQWKINPKRLGRFHIALGTFQEAPERESLIFQWFWKVWGGWAHRRADPARGFPDPLMTNFQRKTKNQTPRPKNTLARLRASAVADKGSKVWL